MPPVVAVIVSDPFATAVTRPDELTVAMLASDEDQVNVLSEIVFPLASRALAVSWTVSPRETSVAVLCVTATEATVCAAGCCPPGPVVISSPPQAQIMRPPMSDTARVRRGATFFWMETVACTCFFRLLAFTKAWPQRSRRRAGVLRGVYCGGGATKATDLNVFLWLICPWDTREQEGR